MNKKDIKDILVFDFLIFIPLVCSVWTVCFVGGLLVGSQEIFANMLIMNDAMEIIVALISIPLGIMYALTFAVIFGLIYRNVYFWRDNLK